MTTSCALIIKLKPACKLTEKTSRQALLELAHILKVKLHASSQKNIPGLSNTGLPVGIRQTFVVARDALLQMHQAAGSIRKAGRITELKFPIHHGIIIQMNVTSYLAQ